MAYKPTDLAALGISKSDLYNAAQLVQRKITLTEEHQVSVQDSEDSTEFTMNFKQFATGSLGWTVNAKFPITLQVPDHESGIEGSTKELELPVTFSANLCIVNSKQLTSDESVTQVSQQEPKKRGRGRPPKQQGSRTSTRDTRSSKSMKESDGEANDDDEDQMVEYNGRSIHGTKRRKTESEGGDGNSSIGAPSESVVAEGEEEIYGLLSDEFVPPKEGRKA